MSKIDKLDQFNSVLLTLLNLPKNTKFLFKLIKYYENDTSKKVEFSKFDELELKQFVLWFLLKRSLKLKYINAYVKTLKQFLKQVFDIDVNVQVPDIARTIRILTSDELSLIRRTQISGFRNKISDILIFRIETGHGHGNFKMVTTDTSYFDLGNYFAHSNPSYLLDRYGGIMPTIPKSDFDCGVKQLLHALKIDRKVKIGDELVPVCDMDVDLLIRNTFTYHASNHFLSMDMISEMFEHDDLSHFFPAISCINNQIIQVNYNKLIASVGRREDPDIAIKGFSFAEQALTCYLLLLHKYGKKDLGN